MLIKALIVAEDKLTIGFVYQKLSKLKKMVVGAGEPAPNHQSKR